MLLGAHVSIAGGLQFSLEHCRKIGGQAMQIFTRNQRTWQAKPLTAEEIRLFRQARDKAQIQQVLGHGSYLVNPAAPDTEILKKSRRTLKEEVKRCVELGIQGLVLHPGASLGRPQEKALERAAISLRPLLDPAQKGGLKILLENTAGQGSVLGSKFSELGQLIRLLEDHEALGVCFDTAHAWGAGYDLRGKKLDSTLKKLTKEVGEGRLAAFHLNDTAVELGSRKDRHASIGKGHLGLALFQKLHRSPRFSALPGILETPSGMEGWADEITQISNSKE